MTGRENGTSWIRSLREGPHRDAGKKIQDLIRSNGQNNQDVVKSQLIDARIRSLQSVAKHSLKMPEIILHVGFLLYHLQGTKGRNREEFQGRGELLLDVIVWNTAICRICTLLICSTVWCYIKVFFIINSFYYITIKTQNEENTSIYEIVLITTVVYFLNYCMRQVCHELLSSVMEKLCFHSKYYWHVFAHG